MPIESKESRIKILISFSVILCFTAYIYQFYFFDNSTFEVLWEEWGIQESTVYHYIHLQIAFLVLGVIGVFLKKFPLILLGIISLLSEMFFHMMEPAAYLPWLTPFEWSLRIICPIVLLYTYTASKKQSILTIALAITFMAHGIKALYGYSVFIDYILHFFHSLHLHSISEANAVFMLKLIGVSDIIFAFFALTLRVHNKTQIFLIMGLWGLITALSRVLYQGLDAWYEVALRAPHYLIPLYLYKKHRSSL